MARGFPSVLAAGESRERCGDVVGVVDERAVALCGGAFPVVEGVRAFRGAGTESQASLDIDAFFAFQPGVPVRTAQAPYLAFDLAGAGCGPRPQSA
ncbi:MAG TPA: hypothetical protein VFI65_08390 [Streptosporangiaceae bacterium]|nr:hypothetical protein [Streptosporangiaceae bacterium]